MAETVAIDCPARRRARRLARRRWRCILIVAAPTLASSKPYACSSGKVTASSSIGSALPTCDTLRRQRRQSPRPAPDADLASAKATLLRIRIEEKQRALVRQSDVNQLTDSLCGVVLMHLGRARGAHRDC